MTQWTHNEPLVLGYCDQNKSSNQVTLFEVSWDRLVERLSQPPKIGTKDGSYITRCAFDNNKRSNNSTMAGYLAVLDGDSTIDPDTGEVAEGAPDPVLVHEVLKDLDITHCIYSSHSHGLKGNRYRVLVPVYVEDKPALEAVVGWLIHELHQENVYLNPVAENTNFPIPWFLPRLREGAEFIFLEHDGLQVFPIEKALEWKPVKPTTAIQKPTESTSDAYASRAFDSAITAICGASNGGRNHALNRQAFGVFGLVKANRLDEGAVRQALANAGHGAGLNQREIEMTLDSAWESSQPRYEGLPEVRQNKTIAERISDGPIVGALMQNPTEDNVSLAFRERYNGSYIYMHGRDRWFYWDEQRWKEDVLNTVFEEMRNLARAHNSKGAATFARSSFFSGCLTVSRADPSFARLADDFDNDNYLLNCPDGTYNLETGDKHKHTPADHITLMTAVSPKQAGGAVFLKFLDEVFNGDNELIEWIQIALGACLSGAIEDHWLMFWIGSGRNGKNTLGDLVMRVLGEYAKAIPSDTLMSKKNGEHKTEIANLKGCRLAVASETEDGDFWAESKLKSLTGDAMLSGRYMRSDFMHFRRTHKHLIYGNHRPQLRSLDKAMRSRLKVVPFNVSFVGREDARLPEKLWNVAGFVLHWLIDGHLKWVEQGRKIGDCQAIRDEVTDYFSMQMTVDNWIIENCDSIDDDERAKYQWYKTGDLYDNFKKWCLDGGAGAPSIVRFGEKLNSMGYEKVISSGKRCVGLVLKS